MIDFKTNKITIVFLGISVIGFFLPWFYFEESVDYSTGVGYLGDIGFIIGYIGSFILVLINEKSKTIGAIRLIFLSILTLTCIYCFIMFPMNLFTGDINLKIGFESLNSSMNSTHYGFYITLTGIIISLILNIRMFIKDYYLDKIY